MRINVIDGTTKPFIVITMFPEEAQSLMGIAEFIEGGPIDDKRVKAMQGFEALLQAGLETILVQTAPKLDK